MSLNGLSPPVTSPRQALRNIASSSGLRMGINCPDAPSQSVPVTNSPIVSLKAPLSAAASESADVGTSPMSGQVSLSNDDESKRTPSVSQSHSLRSKISLLAMRNKSSRNGDRSSTLVTPSTQYEFSEETVQVKEGSAAAEFELVRPVIPRISEMRLGEDGDSERLSVRSGGEAPMDAEMRRDDRTGESLVCQSGGLNASMAYAGNQHRPC